MSLKDTILAKIKSDEVVMRPRFYFTVQVIALGVVIFAILALSIFIFNFIAFSIGLNSQDALLGFGPRGLLIFLQLFPWWLLVLDVILIFVLEMLLRRFKFGYKLPILYLLGGICALSVALGFLIATTTPLNDNFLEHADRHELPDPVDSFYEGARHPAAPDGVIHRGIVMAIQGNTLTIQDTDNGTTTVMVLLPPNDRRATTTNLHVGDKVFIAGDLEEGIFQAFGLHKIP